MTASSACRFPGGALGSRSSSRSDCPLPQVVQHQSDSSCPVTSRRPPSGVDPRRRRARQPSRSRSKLRRSTGAMRPVARRRLASIGLGFLGRGSCSRELSGNRQISAAYRRGHGARLCTKTSIERHDERSGGDLGFRWCRRTSGRRGVEHAPSTRTRIIPLPLLLRCGQAGDQGECRDFR